MNIQIKNIGILAHVDAGKTTVTEQILYASGLTRKIGNVDNGTAITDTLDIERKRGISVRSSAVSLTWKNTRINILDTPGHVDFSAEVDRVLNVLDGAIVVLSAVEGIQAHTLSIIDQLQDLKIPFMLFINKIDRVGAQYEQLIYDLENDLKLKISPINQPTNEGFKNADIQSFWTEELNEYEELNQHISEIIIEQDDVLLNKYLESQNIEKEAINASSKAMMKNQVLIPLLCGKAKTGLGITELLDAITNYLPLSKRNLENNTSAYVYKIEHHESYGTLAHIRVFDGIIKSKEPIFNNRLQKDIKLGITRQISLQKLIDIDNIEAGDIGVLTGIQAIQAGDILGELGQIKSVNAMHIPMMSIHVKPSNHAEYNALRKALEILNLEDPTLDLQWYKEMQEFHLKIIGPLQIEILKDQLMDRFNIEAIFEKPIIIYKERPLSTAEGFVRYWMPKPCWAIMTFKIEPGEIGSGVIFESLVRQSDIHLKYQNEIRHTIPKALKQGIKGWEVTDIKITLIEGSDHDMHSRPGDFVLATPMGLLRGLENAGTEYLEPILSFSIKAPEEHLGKIASDLTRMRATFANPHFENAQFYLEGDIPMATSMSYSIKLGSLTSGKGRIQFKFKEYRPCLDQHAQSTPYIGISPLDEAKWILHNRGAYKSDERA